MLSADPDRLPTLISTAASVAAHAALGMTLLISPLLPRDLSEPLRPREQPVQVRLVTPLAQVNDPAPPKPTPRPPPRPDAPTPPPPPEAATAEPPPPPTDEVVRFDQTDTTLGAQAEGTERLPDPSKGLSEASVRPDGQADAVRLGNTLATDAEGTASGDRFTSVPFSGAARPPRLVAKAPFVAPPAALARQIEGDVVLALTVSAIGAVTDARLVRGLADDIDQACRDNALTSRWTPGARAAGAVTVTDVPFTCRLQRNLED